MRKVLVVGKGNLTHVQEQLLRKAIGEFEVAKQIDMLPTNPKEAANIIPENITDVVLFVEHPVLISTLNTVNRFRERKFSIITFKVEQCQHDDENCKKEADIKYTKHVNGNQIEVYSRTTELHVNPQVKIDYEKVITL